MEQASCICVTLVIFNLLLGRKIENIVIYVEKKIRNVL